MPLVCNYYVTLRCNALCVFCNIPQAFNGASPVEPTLGQIEANLRDLKRLGVRVIDFTGGEPLLYPQLAEALGLARGMGFATTVTTNGILYPRQAEKLKGKISSLLFSVESPDRDAHDQIRRAKCFDKVMESLRVAREMGGVFYISHVVTNEAMAHVDDVVRLAREQEAILYLNPCFSYFGNEGLSPKNALKLMRYFEQPGILLDRAQTKLIADGGNHRKAPVCRAVSSTVVISPDNRLLLPCYHFQQDAVPLDGGLTQTWYSKRVQDARAREGRYDFCEGCAIYCYMRASLYRAYPVDALRTAVRYVHERLRHRFSSGRLRREAARLIF